MIQQAKNNLKRDKGKTSKVNKSKNNKLKHDAINRI